MILIAPSWLSTYSNPSPAAQLIYLHPPPGISLEWSGSGAGYAVTIPLIVLSRLANVAPMVPFFEVWQSPRAISVPTANLLRPLHSFLSVMCRGLAGGFVNNDLNLSTGIALSNCSSFLLTLRHLVCHHVPHDPVSQPRRLAARYAELVELHFTERGDLGFYADKLRITKDHLSKACGEVLGMGAKEFLQQRRFKEAGTLLIETQLSVKEIAYRIGWEDHAYFTRAFKKWCGMTPSQFRLMP